MNGRLPAADWAAKDRSDWPAGADADADADPQGSATRSDACGSFVVIGATGLASRVCASLTRRGQDVVHLIEPNEEELRKAMLAERSGVAVLVHDDIMGLRFALATAHLAPAIPLVVTIFDRTVSDQLTRLLPRCHVTSPAALAAPTLVALCLEPSAIAIQRVGRTARAFYPRGKRVVESPWSIRTRTRWRGQLGWLAGQLRAHDAGTRILLTGLAGMLVVLVGDWLWLTAVSGRPAADAFFEASSVVATVGPASPAHRSTINLALSGLAMLVTIGFTATFTAGVVERLLGPSLVGILGPRTVPRTDHVVVVGLGQVGLRLCQELRGLGVAVVGVERDPHAPNLRIARALGIPVIIAHGGDRAVLEELRIRRARALAAVGSDDLDNVAVAVTANAVAPGTRVVLRAGEHEAIAETRSLFPLGVTRDVTSLSASYVLARLLGFDATMVAVGESCTYLQVPGERCFPWPPAPRVACAHGSEPPQHI